VPVRRRKCCRRDRRRQIRRRFQRWCAGRPRETNEGVDPARLRVADPDPFLPARILHVIGLRVGDVDLILAVEGDPARLSELRPRHRQRFSVLIEDLDAVVAAIADEDAAARIDRDRVNRMELTRRPAALAPCRDELAADENFTMRLLPFSLCPSATNTSPLAATATSLGELK
jgi:hypothetical protein